MDTFDRVCALMKERFELTDDVLSADTTWEDIGADSIDLVDLISELEDTFDISIPDEAIESFKTVGDVADYVNSL